MATNQKDAVHQTVVEFFGNEYTQGMKPTEEQHKAITMKLAEAFVAGTIKHRNPAKVSTIEAAAIYSKGLLSNWLRRDPRLNAPTAA